jgi:hypothetical protein
MKRHFIAQLILLFSMVSTSCIYAGGEDVVKQTRTVVPFSQLKVSTGITVILSSGMQQEVVVEAADGSIDNVNTVVEDGVLAVFLQSSRGWFFRHKQGQVKVYITFTNLTKLEVSSGSTAESAQALDIPMLVVKCSSGASTDLELYCNHLELNASSGADIGVRGRGDFVNAVASSGSSVNAYGFKSIDAEAGASAGGSVDLFADGTVKARASSGGSVNIRGNGRIKEMNQSSGGSIQKK